MVSISVVMPAFNVDIPVLEESVNSILSQTFRDFEFIIIDDCSTNGFYSFFKEFQDERIRLIRNTEHLGITKSLNIGFREARGKYIARMDGDDISLPTRFERQFAFMESHPDVIVCGTNVEFFGMTSANYIRKITDMETYRVELLFGNPGPMHPTAFFNRELLQRYQIAYDEKLEYAQDYGLWVEISRLGQVAILEDILLRYRMHDYQISQSFREKQILCDKLTKEKLLRELLGVVTREELDLHYLISTWNRRNIKPDAEMKNWLRRLVEANYKKGIYSRNLLE